MKNQKLLLNFFSFVCVSILSIDLYNVFKWGTDSAYDLFLPLGVFVVLILLLLRRRKLVNQPAPSLQTIATPVPAGRSHRSLVINIVWAVLFWPILGLILFTVYGASGESYSLLAEIGAFIALAIYAVSVLCGIVLSLSNLTDSRLIHARNITIVLPLASVCIFLFSLFVTALF